MFSEKLCELMANICEAEWNDYDDEHFYSSDVHESNRQRITALNNQFDEMIKPRLPGCFGRFGNEESKILRAALDILIAQTTKDAAGM